MLDGERKDGEGDHHQAPLITSGRVAKGWFRSAGGCMRGRPGGVSNAGKDLRRLVQFIPERTMRLR